MNNHKLKILKKNKNYYHHIISRTIFLFLTLPNENIVPTKEEQSHKEPTIKYELFSFFF